jgi:hypothetical protein
VAEEPSSPGGEGSVESGEPPEGSEAVAVGAAPMPAAGSERKAAPPELPAEKKDPTEGQKASGKEFFLVLVISFMNN